MFARSLARYAGTFTLLAALCAVTACRDTSPPAVTLTAADLPRLAPAAADVRSLLGVDAVDERENDALTQALEGVSPADRGTLATYGHSYTAGDPAADASWSAAGVLFALAPTEEHATRVFDALTAGPAWGDAELSELGDGRARRQRIADSDGFSGEMLLMRTGGLLVHITVIGTAPEPRGEVVDAIVRDVLARRAALVE